MRHWAQLLYEDVICPLIGNVGCLRGYEPREAQAWSGAGGHAGGQDVIRVAVQVLAGPLWCRMVVRGSA